jgi:hypothetical protein
VVRQWQEEMDARFGLSFVVYDREFVTRTRQARGWAINPWQTHTRFIISHALVRDETYAAPLRDVLGDRGAGSLLILDEAHNVAPASSARYAIDSKLTSAMRDLAPRFEHKLFLSATPHNGHSNSFSALLELLDPQRFCRGVPVDAALRDQVMVRRLKSDLAAVGEDFPKRHIRRVELDGLPHDAPELELSRLLQRYRELREARLAGESRSRQAAAQLVLTSLQKRLLSSIEAFARTLEVHRRSIERAEARDVPPRLGAASLLLRGVDADDERAELAESEVDQEEALALDAASRAGGDVDAEARDVLDRMLALARAHRYEPDSRLRHLIGWIRRELCPELGTEGARWHPRRVLIFTEYADTKRYLEQQLADALRGSDRAEARLATFHGGIGEERRERIKAAFNADPERHPLRILIATDAAREGVNLQNHCADLFHFDVPWNPGRLEQRNGRIDRKLQRAPEVRCHYYVLPQRAEDRVLDVLVQKTERIHAELGSLAPVVAAEVDRALASGIPHSAVGALSSRLEALDREAGLGARVRTLQLEVGHDEASRRTARLERSLGELSGLLEHARRWIGLDGARLRAALGAALETLDAPGLEADDAARAVQDPDRSPWRLPALADRRRGDPSWAVTLDTLRAPRARGQSLAEWRRDAPIRPVVFRDPGDLSGDVVHLHLEHRVVQRLLGRFQSMGFREDELRRATVVATDDAEPRVLAFGRLSLFGTGGARLHDELLSVVAAWSPPGERSRAGLKPLGEAERERAMAELEQALAAPRRPPPGAEARDRHLGAHAADDLEQLRAALEQRAGQRRERAERELARRAEAEAKAMRVILEAQRDRILARQAELAGPQLRLGFDADEARQLDADRRHQAQRLARIGPELEAEPARIRAGYAVRAARIEPVGLVYLWPRSR